jgi:hypothetical protein
MNQGKKPPAPLVDVAEEAIVKAQAFIAKHYKGQERSNMEAWLVRFVEEVYKDPFNVLGHPPLSSTTDPDLLHYPARLHYKIAGLAYVSRAKNTVHVYEIQVESPPALVAERAAAEAARVAKLGDLAAKTGKLTTRKPSLAAFKNAGLNKRRKS